MATWKDKQPEIYRLFHDLWGKAHGSPGYDNAWWLKFEGCLALENPGALPGTIHLHNVVVSPVTPV